MVTTPLRAAIPPATPRAAARSRAILPLADQHRKAGTQRGLNATIPDSVSTADPVPDAEPVTASAAGPAGALEEGEDLPTSLKLRRPEGTRKDRPARPARHASGIHIGHALNKVLKEAVTRSRRQIHRFRCQLCARLGLPRPPIEWKS